MHTIQTHCVSWKLSQTPPIKPQSNPTTLSFQDIAARRRAFLQMHESGCFVIPNPWDVGSATHLQDLGFKALATTSSGVAWSQGRCNGGLDRQADLDHLRDMVAATDLPVSARAAGAFATVACAMRPNPRKTTLCSHKEIRHGNIANS